MNKRSVIFTILLFLSHFLLIGCSEDDSATSAIHNEENCQSNTIACSFNSSNKAITSFSLNGTNGKITGSNISVVMPHSTDLTSLIATFTTSGKSVKIGTAEQVSGQTSNDFSKGAVIYTVFAADNSFTSYSVHSTVAIILSSEKEITSFSINEIEGTISNSSITLTVPYGTNLTRLAPNFSASPGAKVFVGTSEQTSGTTQQNFSNGRTITYTVVAEDGSTQNYSVSVSKEDPPLSSEKDITSLSLSENRLELFIFLKPYTAVGVISEYEINFNIKAFAPAYITNMKITNMQVSPKASVYVGSSAVSNGTTLNFTSGNKTFTVKAEDGSTKNYTVKLNCNLILFGLCKRW